MYVYICNIKTVRQITMVQCILNIQVNSNCNVRGKLNYYLILLIILRLISPDSNIDQYIYITICDYRDYCIGYESIKLSAMMLGQLK